GERLGARRFVDAQQNLVGRTAAESEQRGAAQVRQVDVDTWSKGDRAPRDTIARDDPAHREYLPRHAELVARLDVEGHQQFGLDDGATATQEGVGVRQALVELQRAVEGIETLHAAQLDEPNGSGHVIEE